MDDISQPAITDIVPVPFPGQQVVKPGVILMGQEGDPNKKDRPPWAKNGSILVYRHLDQLVPEFDQFKRDNALRKKEIGIDKGAALLGARLFGRWKDGESSSHKIHFIVVIGKVPRYTGRHISHHR